MKGSWDEGVACLKATVETDLELLPYHLFCVFAGVRPKEGARLTWSDVKLEEKFIQVPEETSKTGVRRIVDMEPLLVRWVEYYVRCGGGMDGAVVPTKNLRKRLRAIRVRAGFQHWPQDAPRRTYASNWLAANHDVKRLNNLMGHNVTRDALAPLSQGSDAETCSFVLEIELPKVDSKTIRSVAV